MRCGINMCTSVRANVQLSYTPGGSYVCRQNPWFGMPRKVAHTVFNRKRQINVFHHVSSVENHGLLLQIISHLSIHREMRQKHGHFDLYEAYHSKMLEV